MKHQHVLETSLELLQTLVSIALFSGAEVGGLGRADQILQFNQLDFEIELDFFIWVSSTEWMV